MDHEVSAADAFASPGGSGVDGNGRPSQINGNGRASHGPSPFPDRLARLYTEQLADIRSAERQAAEVFPEMAIVAADEMVASVFRAAASETEIQLARLDGLLESLRLTPDDVGATPLDGFLSEARLILDGEFEGEGRDLDDRLLRSARHSLRYQVAGYESACSTARRLGDYRTLDILLLSLDEELATDSTLSQMVARRSRILRAI